MGSILHTGNEYTTTLGVLLIKGDFDEQPIFAEEIRNHLSESPTDLSELISEVSESIVFEDFLRKTGLPFKLVKNAAGTSTADELWPYKAERRERIQVAVQMIKEGLTLEEIGKRFDKTREMIRLDLKEVGVNSREVKQLRKNGIIEDIRNRTNQGEDRKAIAKALGLTGTELTSLANEGDVELIVSYKKDGHGNPQSYNAGCRCTPCKDANLERLAVSKTKRLAKETPAHVHGTLNGYLNWGCRCTRCKEAKRQNDRDNSRESAKNSHSKGTYWTAEEDKIVMDYSHTAKELALKLGRTLASVNGRRNTLNQRGVERTVRI